MPPPNNNNSDNPSDFDDFDDTFEPDDLYGGYKDGEGYNNEGPEADEDEGLQFAGLYIETVAKHLATFKATDDAIIAKDPNYQRPAYYEELALVSTQSLNFALALQNNAQAFDEAFKELVTLYSMGVDANFQNIWDMEAEMPEKLHAAFKAGELTQLRITTTGEIDIFNHNPQGPLQLNQTVDIGEIEPFKTNAEAAIADLSENMEEAAPMPTAEGEPTLALAGFNLKNIAKNLAQQEAAYAATHTDPAAAEVAFLASPLTMEVLVSAECFKEGAMAATSPHPSTRALEILPAVRTMPPLLPFKGSATEAENPWLDMDDAAGKALDIGELVIAEINSKGEVFSDYPIPGTDAHQITLNLE